MHCLGQLYAIYHVGIYGQVFLQYSGQNLAAQFSNGAIMTKTFVGRARLLQCRLLCSDGQHAIHEMRMNGPAFQARHGAGGQLVISLLACVQFGQGHSRHAHLDMARQRGRRAGRAVAQTRHGCGITAQACTLEARLVSALAACRSTVDVGATAEGSAVRAGLDPQDDTHVALARPRVDHLGVEDNPRIAGRHPRNA